MFKPLVALIFASAFYGSALCLEAIRVESTNPDDIDFFLYPNAAYVKKVLFKAETLKSKSSFYKFQVFDFLIIGFTGTQMIMTNSFTTIFHPSLVQDIIQLIQ